MKSALVSRASRPLKICFGVGMVIGLPVLGSALTINPTFGTSGGASAFSAGDMACINSVIALYQSTFTDAITVNITFNNMNSGLGQSQTTFLSDTYGNVHAKLIADGSSADDTVALAKLVSLVPVTDGTSIVFSKANAKALGYTSGLGTAQDSIIGLNASSCFNVHTATAAAANPTKVDLFAVTCHELDEALGTVSGADGNTRLTADLFRFDGAGARSFTGSTSAHAYFSIDGTTLLDEYNQNSANNGGDIGDWIKHTPNQVQDWQGTAGSIADPNVELRLLDVVGYNRATPEPATIAALGLGAAMLIKRRPRRKS